MAEIKDVLPTPELPSSITFALRTMTSLSQEFILFLKFSTDYKIIWV